MIILSKEQFDSLVEHAKNILPNEDCGLLGGRAGLTAINESSKKFISSQTRTHAPNIFQWNPPKNSPQSKIFVSTARKIFPKKKFVCSKIFWRAINMSTNYKELKKGGFMRQRQPNYFSMRLKSIGDHLTAEQLGTIQSVAIKFGKGYVHLTSR